ncbi:MAG: nucleotide sugar dehydrogenase [Patescibacteria group bacterium]|mgnify:CR=1 FL=1
MKIAVIGMGYVGLVSAVSWARAGHKVIGVESNEEKLSLLKAGKTPFFEPGLETELKLALESQALHFSKEFLTMELMSIESLVTNSLSNKSAILGAVDLFFLCVGTPILPNGLFDLTDLFEAVDSLVVPENSSLSIIIKSTVLPGTTAQVEARLKDGFEKLGKVFKGSVWFAPEFLSEGTAMSDTINPSRVIIGGNSEVFKESKLGQFILSVTPASTPIVITDWASAELGKLASNAMLASRISFINEIGQVADTVGADINLVAKIIGLDPRIGSKFLKAGVGFGGGCFPKDTTALKNFGAMHGASTDLLTAVISTNEKAKLGFSERVIKRFGEPHGKTLGILGMAYKEGTDDIRNSPSLKIIELFTQAGGKVVVYDPLIARDKLERLGVEAKASWEEVAQMVDLITILTADPQFVNLDWQKMRAIYSGTIIGDGRRLYSKKILTKLGLNLIT